MFIASCEKSIPKIIAPFFAALRAKFSVPHPTSKTFFPRHLSPFITSSASDEVLPLVTKCV